MICSGCHWQARPQGCAKGKVGSPGGPSLFFVALMRLEATRSDLAHRFVSRYGRWPLITDTRRTARRVDRMFSPMKVSGWWSSEGHSTLAIAYHRPMRQGVGAGRRWRECGVSRTGVRPSSMASWRGSPPGVRALDGLAREMGAGVSARQPNRRRRRPSPPGEPRFGDPIVPWRIARPTRPTEGKGPGQLSLARRNEQLGQDGP